MARWYVGYKVSGGRDAFKAAHEPTRESHGNLYFAVWGPFLTRRGAEFGASPAADNNPHTLTVQDTERIARKAEATLAKCLAVRCVDGAQCEYYCPD